MNIYWQDSEKAVTEDINELSIHRCIKTGDVIGVTVWGVKSLLKDKR
jgi:hypothetical protein